MPAKVVDASVAGAFAFGEPRALEAEALMMAGDLHAPVLLHYELANIARKKIALERYPELEVRLGLDAILSTNIQLVAVDHTAVLQLALQHSLSSYDASYLWLAQSLNAPLLTFDHRLQRAASGRSAGP